MDEQANLSTPDNDEQGADEFNFDPAVAARRAADRPEPEDIIDEAIRVQTERAKKRYEEGLVAEAKKGSMGVLLRSVIDYDGGVSQENLEVNYAKLAGAPQLEWTRTMDDLKIIRFISAYHEEFREVPSKATLLTHFERQSPPDLEASGRVQVLEKLLPQIRTGFAWELKAALEGQRKFKEAQYLKEAREKNIPVDKISEYITAKIGPANDTSKKPAAPKATTPTDVLNRWLTTGPLVHEPTGFRLIDERTRGGFIHGELVLFQGAPNSAKTLFITQLLDLWARRGVVIGSFAVDESDDGIVTRLVQRLVLPSAAQGDFDIGSSIPRDRFTREDCEARDPETIKAMAAAMGDLPVRFYNGDWTVESAAEDLAAYAKSLGTPEQPRRTALLVDSMQTIVCDAIAGATREPSMKEKIDANVRAVKGVLAKYGMLVGATSEMNRGAYREMDAADKYNDMAAAKESGSLEYGAKIMMTFRNVKGEPGLIQVRLTKNKHGADWQSKEDDIYLYPLPEKASFRA